METTEAAQARAGRPLANNIMAIEQHVQHLVIRGRASKHSVRLISIAAIGGACAIGSARGQTGMDIRGVTQTTGER